MVTVVQRGSRYHEAEVPARRIKRNETAVRSSTSYYRRDIDEIGCYIAPQLNTHVFKCIEDIGKDLTEK